MKESYLPALLSLPIAIASFLGTSPCLAQSSPAAVWTMEEEPSLVLGEGQFGQEDFFVNVVGAAELSDSTIVVADYTRNHFALRYFDASGRLITSAGKFGEGPYEVSYDLTLMARTPGDSIMIAAADGRYSIFGPRGERVRSGRVQLPVGSRPSHLLEHPSRIVAWKAAPDQPPAPGRIAKSRMILFMVDLEDASVDTIATLEGSSTALAENGFFLRLPFQPLPYWGSAKGQLLFAHSAERQLYRYVPDEGPERLFAIEVPRQPVTAEMARTWMEEDLKGTPRQERRTVEDHHERIAFPDSLPIYRDLHVDAMGRFWLLPFHDGATDHDIRWQVLDASGTVLAHVLMPYAVAGTRIASQRPGQDHPILSIGSSVLVRARDEWGAQSVHQYRIVVTSER